MSTTLRLVDRLAALITRRPATRRGFLATATVAGAALATNPWGYLTRPQSAYAATCGTDSSCSSGYSVFCCTINKGHNTCPPNTFVGGWWKADRSSYCGGAARYYIDCNAWPSHPRRCHCNQTTCDHRLVACNVFRYGQCNTDVPAVTAVVCRQISCRPPWELYPHQCGRSSATDNNTAGHTAPCLTKENTYPRLKTFPKAPTRLWGGHSLQPRDQLVSEDRHTRCGFGRGGNLVVVNERGTVWSSKTYPRAMGGHVRMQRDGNLVINDRKGRPVWSTHTGRHHGKAQLHIRNDGQLIVAVDDRILWRSGTHTP